MTETGNRGILVPAIRGAFIFGPINPPVNAFSRQIRERVLHMEDKGYLVLQNGAVFEGKRFGSAACATGELVFTTAMTGYLETLTDPSYYGQIVLQTFPLIGNVGVIPADFESEAPALRGYIVRDWCQVPSNFRCAGELDTFLKTHGIPGLYGIDTRALTRLVRESGVMNAVISNTPDLSDEQRALLDGYRVKNAVASVSRPGVASAAPEGAVRYRVVLWDFGAKDNITRELLRRGCEVSRVPYNATAGEIADLHPDGVMLSNGPGDPAENSGVIEQLRLLLRERIPCFGICLGHQLLALASGARTEKLKYGHRGANQPALDRQTGRVYITSQNHGYAVVPDSLPGDADLRFVNGNDGTCEGIWYRRYPAFSVQFHPEAAGGPQDTGFLFDWFIDLMKGAK